MNSEYMNTVKSFVYDFLKGKGKMLSAMEVDYLVDEIALQLELPFKNIEYTVQRAQDEIINDIRTEIDKCTYKSEEYPYRTLIEFDVLVDILNSYDKKQQ